MDGQRPARDRALTDSIVRKSYGSLLELWSL
jgi:hypothetical protein